jgi:hypothetical protein
MPDKSMDKIMKGADKVAEDISKRDQADIEKVEKRRSVYRTSVGDVAKYPKEYGKDLSDAEIMNAADSAEREHIGGSLYGGRGIEDYENLLAAAKKIREKQKVPNKDPNARLRKFKKHPY